MTDLTKNPFYILCKNTPTVQHHKAAVLDAIAASVAHETWEELYAARRAAYKATNTYLAGDPFTGRVFGDWFGMADDAGFLPEDTGRDGLEMTREAAHEFLDALRALRG